MNKEYYKYRKRSDRHGLTRLEARSIQYEYTPAVSTTNNKWETIIQKCKKYSKTTNLFERRQQYMALNTSNIQRKSLFKDSTNAIRTVSRNSIKIAVNPSTKVRKNQSRQLTASSYTASITYVAIQIRAFNEMFHTRFYTSTKLTLCLQILKKHRKLLLSLYISQVQANKLLKQHN